MHNVFHRVSSDIYDKVKKEKPRRPSIADSE